MFIRHSAIGHRAQKKGDLPVALHASLPPNLTCVRHRLRSVHHRLRCGSLHRRSDTLHPNHRSTAGPSTSPASRSCGWCTSERARNCGFHRTRSKETRCGWFPCRDWCPCDLRRTRMTLSTPALRDRCNSQAVHIGPSQTSYPWRNLRYHESYPAGLHVAMEPRDAPAPPVARLRRGRDRRNLQAAGAPSSSVPMTCLASSACRSSAGDRLHCRRFLRLRLRYPPGTAAHRGTRDSTEHLPSLPDWLLRHSTGDAARCVRCCQRSHLGREKHWRCLAPPEQGWFLTLQVGRRPNVPVLPVASYELPPHDWWPKREERHVPQRFHQAPIAGSV